VAAPREVDLGNARVNLSDARRIDARTDSELREQRLQQRTALEGRVNDRDETRMQTVHV